MDVIVISGVIGWDISPDNIRNKLNNLSGKPVRIEISSPGGFVFDGIEIFNLIRDYKGVTEVRLMGLAASMASYIALAGDKVTAHDNAVYMIHNVWGFGAGDHKDLRQRADLLEGLTKLLAKEYSKKTGKSVVEIRSLMDSDTFLYGEEMVESGFVDEIIETDSEKDKENDLVRAQANIQGCFVKMKENEDRQKEDNNKLAAYLKDSAAFFVSEDVKKDINLQNDTVQNVSKKPAIAGVNKTEEKMTEQELKDLMAKNPALADHIQALEKAARESGHLEGFEAGKVHRDEEDQKSATEYAATILASDDYAKSVKDLALEVVKGNETKATLKAAITVVDSQKEATASIEAQNETIATGATPPQGATNELSTDGVVRNEQDLKAAAGRIGGE